jgi:ammonium transporter, Amt family
MKLRSIIAAGLGGLALALLLDPALAQTAAPAPNKGDTAWMLVATCLVLMMSVPGLALFYGGLVRTKNMLSVLTQVFAIVCLVCLIWVFYGYSLSFTNGGGLNSFVGGFSKAFLRGITPDSTAATFSNGIVIPELVYVCFQMTFAMITPALIVGAFAERMKFSALVLFMVLWVTFIYFPIAHMVWYWAGPDAIADAAKALAAAADGAAKTAAQGKLDEVKADAGLVYQWGALDFAGGTVVHINAGIAGLVGAYLVGRRIGYGKEAMPAHSLPLTMIGASLLWVGWFGFNAGSALEASGGAALAFMNTLLATACAVLSWSLGEALFKGKPTMLGAASGAVAGLVAITPAAGNVGIAGAFVIGLVAGLVCLWGVSGLKRLLGADDSLDVFGVHAVGGIVGALLTGVFNAPELGGPGFVTNWVTGATGFTSIAEQLWVQAKAVGLTIVWSGVVAFIAYKLVDLTIGLRVTEEDEREGLDTTAHGEAAYRI